MNTTLRIAAFQVRDAVRSRWLTGHAVFYLVLTEGLLLAAGSSVKALVSLVNVVLLLVPLVSLVFGAMQLYHSREFVLLLLTQPVRRRELFIGLYAGHAAPLATTFAIGVGLPFAWHGLATGPAAAQLAALVGSGILLTLLFTAVAFLVAIRHPDRVKGIGVALLTWLLFAVVYDGAVLLAIGMLQAWPIEKGLLASMFLNPIDLARVLLLMLFDASALMGYTGAVFARFFGSAAGAVVAVTALAVWTAGPLLAAQRAFLRRDF